MLNKMYRINLNSYPTQINKIVIYKDGEKLAEIEKLSDLLPGLDRVEAFYLPEEPKTARKENLNRKDIYTLRGFASYDTRHQWPKIALYIPADMVQFESLGEFCAMEHDGEKDYLYKYHLTLPAADTLRRHCERLNVPADWTPPAGGHWRRGLGDYNDAYDIISEEQQELRRKQAEKRGEEYEPYNVVHWTETRQTEKGLQVETTSTGHHRIERDDARQERERLAAKLSEILTNCHISHYDVARLEAAGLRIVEA